MQINLQGFLDKNTQLFVLELWKLLISAQTSLGGIPQQFLDITKAEILKTKVRYFCSLQETQVFCNSKSI